MRTGCDICRECKVAEGGGVTAQLRQAEIAFENGDFLAAEALCRETLKFSNNEATALYFLGRIAIANGFFLRSIRLLERAARIEPTNPAIHCCLAFSFEKVGKFNSATESYRNAVKAEPKSRRDQGRLAQLLKTSIGRDESDGVPQHTSARLPYADTSYAIFRLKALGKLSYWVGSFERASDLLRHVLTLNPNDDDARFALALSLTELGAFSEAEAQYRELIDAGSQPATLYYSFGQLLRKLRKFDESNIAYKAALAIQPDFHPAIAGLGDNLLLQGDWENGWPYLIKYNDKLSGKATNSKLLLQVCNKGGALVVAAGGGFGDTIQFSRFLSRIPSNNVLFLVPPELLRLMKTLKGPAQAFSLERPSGSLENSLTLGQVAAVFAKSKADIQSTTPYLRADDAAVHKWGERLRSFPRPRIGLAWKGDPIRDFDRIRSIPREYLKEFTHISNVTWVNLQKKPDFLPEFLRKCDWTERLIDFAETAALIENLDLVIAVDTAVAHLAGALGKPIWLLNRFDSCWRWQFEGEKTPWYSSMRIFRQPRPDDWSAVIDDVRSNLF